MPFKFKYDVGRNILYETAEGDLSYQDFMDYHNKLASASIKAPGNTLVLADFRNARVDLSADEMWKVKRKTDQLAEFYGGVKMAIVATDDFGFGMARMYSMTSDIEDFQAAVFKTMGEARAWLGIEEPEDGSS